MKELNHSTLSDALRCLPEHNPPEALWDQFEGFLDAENLLQKTIPLLPEHPAPEAVWENIEAQLPAAAQDRKNTMHLVWAYAAAAMVTLALAAWWFVRPTTGTGKAAFSVHQESLDTRVQNAGMEPEDDAFAMIDQLCAERMPVCQQPEFKSLRAELDELTAAKKELREAIGQYDDEPELHQQLVRIEKERSEVLREIMNLI